MKTFYEAKVLFETNIDTNGCSYLIIYGKHVNGYFCCIPNWNIGCEMSDPNDTFWNYESLCHTNISEQAAEIIAKEIKKIMKNLPTT